MTGGGLWESESERAFKVRELSWRSSIFFDVLAFLASCRHKTASALHQKDGTGCAQGTCPRACLIVCFLLLLWMIVCVAA